MVLSLFCLREFSVCQWCWDEHERQWMKSSVMATIWGILRLALWQKLRKVSPCALSRWIEHFQRRRFLCGRSLWSSVCAFNVGVKSSLLLVESVLLRQKWSMVAYGGTRKHLRSHESDEVQSQVWIEVIRNDGAPVKILVSLWWGHLTIIRLYSKCFCLSSHFARSHSYHVLQCPVRDVWQQIQGQIIQCRLHHAFNPS